MNKNLSRFSEDTLGLDLISELAVYAKYSRVDFSKQRKETYLEICDRLKSMHMEKYPQLSEEIEDIFRNYVYTYKVLPSMRSLQFGGEAAKRNNSRIYNCSYIKPEDPKDIADIMFLLMSGVGVGYGVFEDNCSKFRIDKTYENKAVRKFNIEDSSEGWADAIKALVESYTNPNVPYKYEFKYTAIRPAGSLIRTAGGIAPGPEPLKRAIKNVKSVFQSALDSGNDTLRTIDLHDIICYMADCVISGGNRRSALIALFHPDDMLMFNCKSPDQFNFAGEGLNLHRSRANNSCVVDVNKGDEYVKKYLSMTIDKAVESGFGEPGVFLTSDDSGNWGTNPCGEIGLNSHQFCNLTTINVSTCEDQDDFLGRCRAASFIGTLQAGYTAFPYISSKWERVTKREALLGVSMTGIASRFLKKDGISLSEGAIACRLENERVAAIIGIEKAARITTVKPEGTASKVAKTSAGIHAWHNSYYIQRITFAKIEPVFEYIRQRFDGLKFPGTDKFILQQDPSNPESVYFAIPVKAPEGALTRHEPVLDMLNRIRTVYREWILNGFKDGQTNEAFSHNVSCTVNFKKDEVLQMKEWLLNNYDCYRAFSLSPSLTAEEESFFPFLMWEDITEESYYEAVKLFSSKEFWLPDVLELVEFTNHATQSMACVSGACDAF